MKRSSSNQIRPFESRASSVKEVEDGELEHDDQDFNECEIQVPLLREHRDKRSPHIIELADAQPPFARRSQFLSPYPNRGRQAILYTSSRSPSLVTTRLEPVYPWDLDEDDEVYNRGGKNDPRQYEDEDHLHGNNNGHEVDDNIDNGDDEEYEHPSLEKRKSLSALRRGGYMGESEDDLDNSSFQGESALSFAEFSFRKFSRDYWLRKICITIVLNPWFERLTMSVILLNCVTLGMFQPCEDATCDSKRCQVLKVCDDVIYLYFAVEMCIKMFAMGVAGRGCYLSETWNRLDFFIVMAGALEYFLDVEKLNLSAIRTVRVLRPLRAINRIPSMRILVMLLLDTLPMLGNVLLLCFFVFFIFGIIGVQLWAGLLRQRCFIPENMQDNAVLKSKFFKSQFVPYYQSPDENEKEWICSTPDSSGMHKCGELPYYEEDEVECHASIETGLYNSSDCINWNQYFTDCKPGAMNPFHGAISFDNIGLAWVAIFLVISLEGWTDVMYFVQDAHSFWNWVYFVLLIVIGSFFMINLCLVVIATQFSETKRRETAKMKAERARFQSSSTLSSFTNSETTNCYRQVIRLIAHLFRKAMSRTRKLYRKHRLEHLNKKEMSLMEKQEAGKLQNHHIRRNVYTQSVINPNNGQIDLKIELDDVTVSENRVPERLPICQSEKMTQTEACLLDRGQAFSRYSNRRGGGGGGVGGVQGQNSAANEASPCNHPSLTCQELLALSSALSATLTAQIGGFNASQIKHCSTYNLPEVGQNSDEKLESGCDADGEIYELAVTPKRPSRFIAFCGCCGTCLSKCQDQLEKFVDHNIFQRFILFCILINTFSMGIEFHKQPEFLTKTVEISNLVFSAIFAIEMLLKLAAYGLFKYISDGFNVFDGIIVIFSSMELYTGFVHGIHPEGGSTGLSVLRTFRLLRILKLVRFLPNLRRQLVVMLRTMDNVAVFFGLLMLFIFIFSILGMNLFGCKFCDGDVCDRKNFDTLLWATVTVFQVLTQEDWNIVLFLGMKQTNHWAALYFVTLMTFGNYVLFNLLVAILVEGFSNQDDKRSSDRNSLYSKDANSGAGLSQSPCQSLHNSSQGGPRGGRRGDSLRGYRRPGSLKANGDSMVKQMSYAQSPKLSKHVMETLRNNVLEMGEPMQLMLPCSNCGETRVVMARQIKKEDVECNPVFAEFLQQTKGGSPPNGTMSFRRTSRGSKTSRSSSRRRRKPSKCCSLTESTCSKCEAAVHPLAANSHFTDISKSVVAKNGSNGRANSVHLMENGDNQHDRSSGCRGMWEMLLYWRRTVLSRWVRFKYERETFSLWIFKPDDKFRIYCQDLTSKTWFDFIVLVFIASNCITLAMERPNIPPWSWERQFLDLLNNIFTFVFFIEMLLKAIATGLLYGEHAYFKSGWNIMDGSLVIISLVDTVMVVILGQTSKIFGILRVFRLVRALRPLRVINRAPGLKLVVQTLLSSLKPIGNIVLICCTFFIIFGILGVQLFKGIFYYCEGPDAHRVKNKTQCLELSGRGNRWINHKYNFDNLGQALMSLFVLSSKDGWVNIMYQGLDAVGLDQQPRENFNEWRLIYFISFLLLVGFFVLNMFVGVVVENFHRCRAEQEKEERARRAAKRAKKIEERRRKMMETPYYIHYSPNRLMVHKMVTSKYFDLAISAVIGLNVITMAMEFYMMPRILANALKVFNYFFTAVFILEAGMKVSALGLGRYLQDRWNQLDVVIVILSILGIVLEELKSDLMPINPTIMRVMRVLRIARVLKLLKMAKGIRALLDTVMQALPQVGNLGLLFFLLFFIFAALGVEMFGRLECDDHHPCQGLGEHAHFRSFGMAFLTLFRIATGDNWNGIMKDTLREECEEGDECLRNCCVSPYFAPLFFVVFVLMAQFVLVNVVVAVLMKHLEESHKQMEDDVEVELELEKQLSLAREMF